MKSELIKRMSIENVYLKNPFENIVFKRVMGKDEIWFAKMKGLKEYRIEIGSHLLAETFLEGNEITKEEYGNY